MTKFKKKVSVKVGSLLLSSVLLFALGIFISRTNLSHKFSKADAYVGPPLISFPADHNKHNTFNSEWWYLNMLTKTVKTDGTSQKDLAYVLSFQRFRLFGIDNNFLLSSRYDNSNKNFKEGNDAGSLTVNLVDKNWLSVTFKKDANTYATLIEQPIGTNRKRTYKLSGKNSRIGTFNLILKERTVVATGLNTPLLWGCRGRISVFAPDDTYYYSIPDLDISGTITDTDGVQRKVSVGKAWIDHQWFNSIKPANWLGHYWTNFHLTTSNDLYNSGPHRAIGMVTQIYNTGPKYTYWVGRQPDGSNQCGQNASFKIDSYNNGFPSAWTLNVSGPSNSLNGYGFSNNQIYTIPTGGNFVEMASYFKGTFGGVPVTGLGFFETSLKKQ